METAFPAVTMRCVSLASTCGSSTVDGGRKKSAANDLALVGALGLAGAWFVDFMQIACVESQSALKG